MEGKLQTPVSSIELNTRSDTFGVIADGLIFIVCRDLFDQIGFAVTQSSLQKVFQVNTLSPHSEFKENLALKFPDLISRVGRSKKYVAKLKLPKTFQPRHQKGRRIHNNLKDKVNKKLKKLP